MRLLIESDISGERFLITGSNQSFKELMTCIAKELNVKSPSKKVSKLVVNIVRRVLSFVKRITGSRSDITKETVDNLFATKSYDNSKVREALNFEFRNLEEQVKNAVAGKID